MLREPASRAMSTISTEPLYISGTSISKRRLSSSLSARETMISGPSFDCLMDWRRTFTFWPTLYLSYAGCSAWGMTASARPISTVTCLGSIFWTVTVNTSPLLVGELLVDEVPSRLP